MFKHYDNRYMKHTIKTSITVLLFAFLAIGHSQFPVMNIVGKDFATVCEDFYSDSSIIPSSKSCDGLLIGETTWLDSEYSIVIEANSQGIAKSMTLGTEKLYKKSQLDTHIPKKELADIQDFYDAILNPVEKLTVPNLRDTSLRDLETLETEPLAVWLSDDQAIMALLYVTRVDGLYTISTHIQSNAEQTSRSYSNQNETSEIMVDFATTLFKTLLLEPFTCPDNTKKRTKSSACGFTKSPFIRFQPRINAVLDDYEFGTSKVVINPWELSVVQGSSVYRSIIEIDDTTIYLTFIDMAEDSALIVAEVY